MFRQEETICMKRCLLLADAGTESNSKSEHVNVVSHQTFVFLNIHFKCSLMINVDKITKVQKSDTASVTDVVLCLNLTQAQKQRQFPLHSFI